MLAAALDRPPVLLRLDLPADVKAMLASDRVVRAGDQPAVVAGAVARAQALHFPTVPGADGHARQAQAWFDPPGLPGLVPRAGEQRPLMVLLHGGPTSHIAHRTSHAGPAYSTKVQFRTTRGYAVVDANHGASSGYGRAYCERLRGQWGVVDLQDAVAAVDHLVASGWG